MRTWVDRLHRSLHLGEFGRRYSELAASWLGVIAAAGVGLWAIRAKKTRKARQMLGPTLTHKGLRRVRSGHGAVGIWAALGILFLSSTGITWSQHGGGNFSSLREAVDWTTPQLSTALEAEGPCGGAHAGRLGRELRQLEWSPLVSACSRRCSALACCSFWSSICCSAGAPCCTVGSSSLRRCDQALDERVSGPATSSRPGQ
ncbi:MAG: PepSY domain-containing protein [Nesterenkonia sp.]